MFINFINCPLQRHLKYKVAISVDSKFYTLYCQQPLKVLCETEPVSTEKGGNESLKELQNEKEELGTGGGVDGEKVVTSVCFERSQSESAGGEDGDEDEEDYSSSADSQTLVRMLEDHEKVRRIIVL